jgi:hypothetical protein
MIYDEGMLQLNKNQEFLVKILSSAIRGNIFYYSDRTDIDFSIVMKEAELHQVHTLIYPILNKNQKNINPELLSEWKLKTNISATLQIQNIHNFINMLECFDTAGITIVALKGLVIRNLYSQPELRIMSDVDILVKSSDIKRSKRLLKDSGYSIYESSSKHYHFKCRNKIAIELHKQLLDHRFINNADQFEKEIWNNLATANLGKTFVKVLLPQYELLYLCLHSAIHMMLDGFGLRQLCDIVLFIETNYSEIDWNLFVDMISRYGIAKYTKALFRLCEILLDFHSPIELFYEKEDENNMEYLIQYIFSGGVFGSNEIDHFITNKMIRYSNFNGPESLPGKLESKLSFLFPSVDKMDTTYNYAKENPFLLPIAWIHRIFISIFRKDFTLSDKFRFLHSNVTTKNSLDRAKLLYWMNLIK